MIPFLFPFSRGLLFPLVALDKIWIRSVTSQVYGFLCILIVKPTKSRHSRYGGWDFFTLQEDLCSPAVFKSGHLIIPNELYCFLLWGCHPPAYGYVVATQQVVWPCGVVDSALVSQARGAAFDSQSG